MRQPIRIALRHQAGAGVIGFLVAVAAVSAAETGGNAQRGQYLAAAGGCVSCHTDQKPNAVPYAGGRALPTPFGTFYGPNITPDQQAGIGRWTEADFIRAMRHGERPDGAAYYPAFPYASFTRISDSDLKDLWAFLRTVPASAQRNPNHDLKFPFSWRPLVKVWKQLFFTAQPAPIPSSGSDVVNRGAYLVQALDHCGECHTPRNFFGGPVRDRFLAGGKGPDGKRIPNITPTTLKEWSDAELREFLLTGMTPDGDSANETMAEVIRNTTSKLTPADLTAVMAYLRSLPALPNEPK